MPIVREECPTQGRVLYRSFAYDGCNTNSNSFASTSLKMSLYMWVPPSIVPSTDSPSSSLPTNTLITLYNQAMVGVHANETKATTFTC
jgi:hypothetical protein